jgi:hypothetical protein
MKLAAVKVDYNIYISIYIERIMNNVDIEFQKKHDLSAEAELGHALFSDVVAPGNPAAFRLEGWPFL